MNLRIKPFPCAFCLISWRAVVRAFQRVFRPF
jgi:hypothetical protein